LRQLQNDTKRDRRSNTWNNPAKFKRKHLDRNKVDDHLLTAGADYMISGDQLTLKADFLRSHVPQALGESVTLTCTFSAGADWKLHVKRYETAKQDKTNRQIYWAAGIALLFIAGGILYKKLRKGYITTRYRAASLRSPGTFFVFTETNPILTRLNHAKPCPKNQGSLFNLLIKYLCKETSRDSEECLSKIENVFMDRL
jgi:hypothetical protein